MKRLAPDTLLQNRYKVSNLIGKGGMGEVYLAIDQRLGHSVALKRTTVGGDALLAEAFEREAKILAQLRHAVLPKVSDHFSEDDEQYLVMEYIEGEDLHRRLKSTQKPFPLNWVLFWADQLLEALTYLHTYVPPIIHRDIKPQNLKLTSDNRIVLLDFGLSKNSLDQTRATTSGSVVGYTPHYAPMEQIRGTGTSPKSDVYAFSATFYQLLTNAIPPDALTRADSLLSGLPDPLEPLTVFNDEVSPKLSSVIIKGMELSQEKRFGSARDMQKALRKAFNELQESMSADTVAFKIGGEKMDKSDFKTEVMSGIPAIPPTPPIIEDQPSSEANSQEQVLEPESDFSGDKTEVIDVSVIRGIIDDEDVDSTKQSSPEVDDSIGMKTEMFVRDDASQESESDQSTSEEIPSVPEEDDTTSDVSFVTNDDDVTSSEFETSEEASEAGGFIPDATVPIISLEDDSAELQGESVPSDVQSQEDTSGAFGLNEGFESSDQEDEGSSENIPVDAEESQENDEGIAVAPPPQKSGTGKYVAILGGLGVFLFVLLGAALAAGWYFTGGSFGFADGNINTTPSPEPTVTQTPEPEPTPDDVNTDTTFDDANSNANVANEDEGNTNISNQDEGNINSNTGNEIEPPQRSETPRSTPRRTPNVSPRRTPRVRATPRRTARPTPKRQKNRHQRRKRRRKIRVFCSNV